MAIPQLTRKLSERENSFPGLSIKQPTSLEDISVHLYMHAVAYLGFHFGGVQNFSGKWGYLMHGAKRHAARGKATRLLGGMLPRENF